jgi:hypothetical protein
MTRDRDRGASKSIQPFSDPRRTAEQSQSNRCPCQRCAFSHRAADSVAIATSFRDARFRNTGDLQWKMRAVCNARPCAGERKAADARTMGINGKAMRRTMESNEKYRAVATSSCTPQERRWGDLARLKSKARPKRLIRTRECHSALTAMRRSGQECQRNSICPRYSGVRGSWPIDASRRAAQAL